MCISISLSKYKQNFENFKEQLWLKEDLQAKEEKVHQLKERLAGKRSGIAIAHSK
jgi:hypothetical protein